MVNTQKGWPTITVSVPDYDWTIEVHELSVEEQLQLAGLRKKGSDKDGMAFVAQFIKSWNATDRDGNPLPVGKDAILKIPVSVLDTITKYLILGRRADPKALKSGNSE